MDSACIITSPMDDLKTLLCEVTMIMHHELHKHFYQPMTAKAIMSSHAYNWGEPERAPHRRVCCEFSIYVSIHRKRGHQGVYTRGR